jgi:uncharacterized protein YebE (UPF0316 family)
MTEFLISALTLFLLRLVDISLYTIRIMMVVRGRKRMAWIFGFFQSIVFVTALRAVLSDLGNWGKILGYAAGFATGVVLGMWIEGRLAIGYTHLRVISPRRGAELAEQLRQAGYAVTEVSGNGKDGMVSLLNCSVLRRKAPAAINIVEQTDPEAFITAEAVRAVRRGFWGG